MNGKTIRQSLAILALGFVVVTTGCNQTPKDAAFFEACYGSGARAVEVASRTTAHAAGKRDGASAVTTFRIGFENHHRDAVTRIDRALSRAEVYSQYDKATADEYFAQGLNH